MTTLEATVPHYSGVTCRSCGMPIAVTQRKLHAVASSESAQAGDREASVLNLRCKLCHKENFYNVSNVVEMHGTPLTFPKRPPRPAVILHPAKKLTRAANG